MGTIPAIPQQPQRQDALDDQLRDLAVVADRLGMYDAADVIRRILQYDTGRQPARRPACGCPTGADGSRTHARTCPTVAWFDDVAHAHAPELAEAARARRHGADTAAHHPLH